jgi:hypothetical protein
MATGATIGGTEILALVALTGAVIFAGSRIGAIWAGRRRPEEIAPPWWVWGTGSWRALVRASAAFYLSTVLLLLGFVAAVVHNALAGESRWVEWLGRALLGALVTSLLLSACVVAFNRPRLLVPPRFRGD